MSLFNQFSTRSPLKSNGWLVLLPYRLCWTWSSAVAHRVAPHSVADTAIAKDILTEMKFVSAQTARISHTSKHHSLHTMTKRWMMTHDLILHCVVLLQLKCWKESAHHSSILDHYMFYNIQPWFIHLYINLYIITCQSSASSHIIY